jgi:hypothetical protein
VRRIFCYCTTGEILSAGSGVGYLFLACVAWNLVLQWLNSVGFHGPKPYFSLYTTTRVRRKINSTPITLSSSWMYSIRSPAMVGNSTAVAIQTPSLAPYPYFVSTSANTVCVTGSFFCKGSDLLRSRFGFYTPSPFGRNWSHGALIYNKAATQGGRRILRVGGLDILQVY